VLGKETEKRIDAEFHQRVERESKRMATVELEKLRRLEWPRFLTEHIGPRASTLAAEIQNNLMGVIRKTEWLIECDKCTTPQSWVFTSIGIEDLLRHGYVMVECVNDTCRDFWGKHGIKLTFQDLIRILLTS
jgi:hypothetical protein